MLTDLRMTTFEFKPIGIVHSCYPDKFGTPRQSGLVPDSQAFLEIYPQFQPELSLDGLNGYSHLWIIFVFHKNNSERYHAKVHPPRLEGETMGLFATRSPHRPNPIGLSLVKIKEVTKTGVFVEGIDLIENTPILDIKPYLPKVEAIPQALSGWTSQATQKNISIHWVDEAKKAVSDYEIKGSKNNLIQLIEQTLALDPRPLVYRGYESANESSPYRDNHAVRIYDLDIHFNFKSPTEILISDIIEIKK